MRSSVSRTGCPAPRRIYIYIPSAVRCRWLNNMHLGQVFRPFVLSSFPDLKPRQPRHVQANMSRTSIIQQSLPINAKPSGIIQHRSSAMGERENWMLEPEDSRESSSSWYLGMRRRIIHSRHVPHPERLRQALRSIYGAGNFRVEVSSRTYDR